MADFATWCWQARTQARLTQAEAAEACGVSLRTWRRWENRESRPARWLEDRARDAMAVELVAFVAAAGRREP
jgi:transcriptional regulator with XRE-family HTH domain